MNIYIRYTHVHTRTYTQSWYYINGRDRHTHTRCAMTYCYFKNNEPPQ